MMTLIFNVSVRSTKYVFKKTTLVLIIHLFLGLVVLVSFHNKLVIQFCKQKHSSWTVAPEVVLSAVGPVSGPRTPHRVCVCVHVTKHDIFVSYVAPGRIIRAIFVTPRSNLFNKVCHVLK